MVEEYRRTLEALNKLLKRKQRQRASQKEIDVLCEEIAEVSETLTHLTKGANRYRWKV